KVFGPDMLARIEQHRHSAGFGIAANEISSLVKIAPEAGEREVFERVISFMLAGCDVLDLERDSGLVIAMQMTVLRRAASIRTRCGEPARGAPWPEEPRLNLLR